MTQVQYCDPNLSVARPFLRLSNYDNGKLSNFWIELSKFRQIVFKLSTGGGCKFKFFYNFFYLFPYVLIILISHVLRYFSISMFYYFANENQIIDFHTCIVKLTFYVPCTRKKKCYKILTLCFSKFYFTSKIEKVPRGIRGEKSSEDMASSRNLVSTIGALASPKMGDGTRCPEG